MKFMQKTNWTKYFKEFIPLIYENFLQIKKSKGYKNNYKYK